MTSVPAVDDAKHNPPPYHAQKRSNGFRGDLSQAYLLLVG
jgi:hypothetical protein